MDEKEWKIGDWPFEKTMREYQSQYDNQASNYYMSSGKFFLPNSTTTTGTTSDLDNWYNTTTPTPPPLYAPYGTATSITAQQQKATNMKHWYQMLNQLQQDPKEEERKLLSEIRQRAQYYALILLMECGVPA